MTKTEKISFSVALLFSCITVCSLQAEVSFRTIISGARTVDIFNVPSSSHKTSARVAGTCALLARLGSAYGQNDQHHYKKSWAVVDAGQIIKNIYDFATQQGDRPRPEEVAVWRDWVHRLLVSAETVFAVLQDSADNEQKRLQLQSLESLTRLATMAANNACDMPRAILFTALLVGHGGYSCKEFTQELQAEDSEEIKELKRRAIDEGLLDSDGKPKNNGDDLQTILQKMREKMAAEKPDNGKSGENFVKNLQHSVDAQKGGRPTMEDEHDIQLFAEEGQAFFGVYDGHGGRQVATYVKKNLVKNIREEYKKNSDPEKALTDAFARTDADLKDVANANQCGSTAALAWINGQNVHIAHVADARVLLFDKDGKVLHITKDHKPNSDDEKKRIQAAGGVIFNGRVFGTLAVPRSFGDFQYVGTNGEKLIISEPTITTLQLTGKEAYMVVACDGLWDVMDNKLECDIGRPSEVGAFILNKVKEGTQQDVLAKVLVKTALSKGSTDNVSAIIVKFGEVEKK
ncbi:MAG: protein serine/threonine phosphatase 2C family protein [Epsilonproteobacteria bacterium]|nr:protein serine/threonine phosphatase 2C family protein [Campylobacterota bacterium]